MRLLDSMYLVMIAIVIAGAACDRRTSGGREGRTSEPKRRVASEPGGVVRSDGDAGYLVRMGMPHHEVGRQFGPHRCVVRSRLVRRVEGQSEEVIEQRVLVEQDGDGRLRARKHTSPHSGVEIIWTGEWLYVRLRHNPYMRRRPAYADEPAVLAGRVYGLLDAYLDLLGPSVTVARIDEGMVAGRPAVKLQLGLGDGEASEHPPESAASRAWRETIRVEDMRGTAWVAKKSGVPLKVNLQAAWSFALPRSSSGETGIPRRLAASDRGHMQLSIEHEISVDEKLRIAAPDEVEVVADVRRRRLEVERQMVLGERPLDLEWRRRGP